MSFETTRAPIMRGELARRFGCHPETVRYYEKIGIMEPSRSEGNIRLYSDSDIAYLKRVKETLDEVSREREQLGAQRAQRAHGHGRGRGGDGQPCATTSAPARAGTTLGCR